MSKKKKNSNYVTDKTVAAKMEKEALARKKQLKKTLKPIILTALIVILIVGAILLIGIPLGMYDYHPESTSHVSITLEGYDEALHVELYGDDAPDTVANFLALVEDKDLVGKALHTYKDGLLYGGAAPGSGSKITIKGEFSENGFENKIAFTRGIIAMERDSSGNTITNQFFILTEDAPELEGKYAAFAKITGGMEVIDEIIKSLETDNSGLIKNPPKIKSISAPHAAH